MRREKAFPAGSELAQGDTRRMTLRDPTVASTALGEVGKGQAGRVEEFLSRK